MSASVLLFSISHVHCEHILAVDILPQSRSSEGGPVDHWRREWGGQNEVR